MRPFSVLIAAIALLAAVPAAQAYELQVAPRLTDANVVRYHNATAYRDSVREAARAVNRARVGVRLVPTTARGEADIRIGYLRTGCRGTHRGEATRGELSIARGCRRDAAGHAVLHEFGHALGLAHEDRRCSVMNSWWIDGKPEHCRRFSWKRPLQPDDIAGLRAIWLGPGPAEPTARIKVLDESIRAGEPVDFIDASGGDGGWVAEWSFGDGATGAGPAVRHVFGSPGTYWVRLQVAAAGRASSVALLVTVLP